MYARTTTPAHYIIQYRKPKFNYFNKFLLKLLRIVSGELQF